MVKSTSMGPTLVLYELYRGASAESDKRQKTAQDQDFKDLHSDGSEQVFCISAWHRPSRRSR